MQNHLKNQTSPYLLQHVENPVDWYPWGTEAFQKAEREEKPVFLSIGYSTCHWCHVMAHESFEDGEIAEILNQHFISVKVDKEERPDIDNIYMSVCQAFTGSGGWPTTIFLTADQKPFFAGTYFPKTTRYGQIGLRELLLTVVEKWETDRAGLLESADEIVTVLKNRSSGERILRNKAEKQKEADLDETLISYAVTLYKQTFDEVYGGFGDAPKFPTPHNLLFLMQYYEKYQEKEAMKMAEKTLHQMYCGGIFDHIGGGFSRYSTDRYFLVPHFEKMLYDNALLILAYCRAYQLTEKRLYLEAAEKTAGYILREMTDMEGGFYSAQDADSEGVEGKYYLLETKEMIKLLGETAGEAFNRYFDLTREGNFEGKNIPNRLKNNLQEDCSLKNGAADVRNIDKNIKEHLQTVYEYRKNRYALHLDDKILTSWNGLMIAAMCHLYRISGRKAYLDAAQKAQRFIEEKLCENGMLFVSYRNGKRSERGFLDDYANEIFALLALYQATLNQIYLEKAEQFCEKVMGEFYDRTNGGFFLYGEENEQLILRPKECYDGAMPSGNSVMAYNLVQLYLITGKERFEKSAKQQLAFMSTEARRYPASYAMFLMALSDYCDAPEKIVVVLEGEQEMSKTDTLTELPCKISLSAAVSVLQNPTEEYPLKNQKTTYYVCKGRSCQPPVNELNHD